MGLEFSSDEEDRRPGKAGADGSVVTDPKNIIEINVIDPMNKKKETFKCEKGLLLREMKFFDLYNKEAQKSSSNTAGIEDLDISIQCQIQLFKWLIKYIRNKSAVEKISYKNVHQILISADFLIMPELIEACLNYIRDNIREIVEKSENIPTYKSHLAKKLARLVPIETLDNLPGSRDQLVSRLYKKKLELFFED